MRRSVILLLLIFAYVCGAFAQSMRPPSLRFNQINTEQGLKEQFVENVLEDHNGFIWMATPDGLYRYDGYGCKVYKNKSGDSTSLLHNYIYGLYEDSQDRLWIGYRFGGMSRYNPECECFQNMSFADTNMTNSAFKNSLREITEDRDGNMWVLNAYGVAKLASDTDQWQWYTETLDGYQMKNRYSYAFAQMIDGTIMLGFRDYGKVFKYDAERDGFTELALTPSDKNSKLGKSIAVLTKDSFGDLWAGSITSGIFRINLATNTYRQYKAGTSTANGLRSNEIMSIYEDSKKRLWVGTINGGLHLYDRENDYFFNYTTETANSLNISSNSVARITEDVKGNIWIATHGGGANVIDFAKNKFLHYELSNKPGSELNSSTISCFYQENNDELWIGTDGGGLHRINLNTNSTKTYTTSEGLSSNAIIDIEPNGDGTLWLSTWGGGVALFDPQTETSTNYVPHKGNSINFPNTKGVMKDGKYLWISTHGKGINILNTETGTFYSDSSHAPGIDFDYLKPYWGHDVVKDSKGRYWITTGLGLHLFDGKKLYDFYTEERNTSVRGNIINQVFQDSKGNIWIGANGLSLYIEQTGEFENLREGNSQMPDMVRSIVEDENGVLWLGSNNGIYRFDYKNDSVSNFTEEDGLQSDHFYTRSAYKLMDGRLAFGGNNGFNIFDPTQIHIGQTETNLLLESCNIWTQRNGRQEKIDILRINDSTVNYVDSRMISFEYFGINIGNSNKLQYSYRLTPFDEDWRFVGDVKNAVYTNLPPGEYTFAVKSRIGDGAWTPKHLTYNFSILAPWYMTLWFRSVATILTVGLALSLIFLRIRSEKNKNQVLNQMVAERTIELEEVNIELGNQREEAVLQNKKLLASQILLHKKNEELSNAVSLKDKLTAMIAHDLRNSLNSIMGFSSLLRMKTDILSKSTIKDYSVRIDDSAQKLHKQFSEMLAWAKSHPSTISHTPKQLDTETLARDIASLVNDSATEKGVTLTVSGSAKHNSFADQRMIAVILRNLIGNAIKFTPSGGTIDISVYETEHTVCTKIKDSGIGIEASRLAQFNESGILESSKGTAGEVGTGIGLPMCAEFAKTNGGSLSISSIEGEYTEINLALQKGEKITEAPQKQEKADKSTAAVSSIPEQTMLIVEDNTDLLQYMSDLFMNKFIIETATNGKEGFTVANECMPDVILSDVDMPGMNGHELCKAIKNNSATSHIPILLITGKTSIGEQLSGLDAGANDYISKPFDQSVLQAKVAGLMENMAKMREHFKLQILAEPENTEMPESKEVQLLRLVNDLISKNIRTPDLSVEFLAEAVGMSRSHLYRKFKAIVGVSPVEYIRSYRIKRAAELLRSNTMRVSEVAYEVGFSDPKYFSSCFKKEFKISPSDFQNGKS